MNDTRAEGKFDQIKGKIKQSVGEAVGNDRLANSGAADQVKGNMKEGWGATKDAARSVANDHTNRAGALHDDTLTGTHSTTAGQDSADAAHDVRNSVVSAARKVKDAVTGESDDVRSNHRRSA